MKKSVIIIMTIALLGLIGLYTRNPQSSAHLVAADTTKSSSASTPLSAAGSSTTSSASQASYKDGTYTGASIDTLYGTVQIAVVISGGKITDVNFLQMPSDLGHSQEVTSVASPLLKQTTLQNQSAHIDFVSGATSTSGGYQASLQAALDKAVQS